MKQTKRKAPPRKRTPVTPHDLRVKPQYYTPIENGQNFDLPTDLLDRINTLINSELHYAIKAFHENYNDQLLENVREILEEASVFLSSDGKILLVGEDEELCSVDFQAMVDDEITYNDGGCSAFWAKQFEIAAEKMRSAIWPDESL